MYALKFTSVFLLVCLYALEGYTQETLSPAQKKEFAKIYGVTGESSNKQEFIKSLLKKQNQSQIKGNNFLTDSTADSETIKNFLYWHDYTLELSKIDHLTSAVPTDLYAEQLGPHKASRAFAITHIALFEAINSIIRKYDSYHSIQKKIFDLSGLPSDISITQVNLNYAIAVAAKETLLKLYPKKSTLITIQYDQFIQSLPTQGASKDTSGVLIGRAAATAIWRDRSDDRADYPEPPASSVTTNSFRNWTKDPLSNINTALGGNWNKVRPFVILSQDAFRPSPPPSFSSQDFVSAFDSVKNLGGDPLAEISSIRRPTLTRRNGEELQDLNDSNETYKGILWGYDGTGNLCAPPRLYNMIALDIANQMKKPSELIELARYFALINLAMADAGISAWEAKYWYNYPRPITLIRNIPADLNTQVQPNSFWTPLGAPVTNSVASKNFTPPFPAYPSGHAVFGAALFQTLRRFYAVTDDAQTTFTFHSDEYNGVNKSARLNSRRSLTDRRLTFDQSEWENAQSRIWLGIHWQFDADNGIKQGRNIGNFIFEHIYTNPAGR